jgi:hypothetical protein
MVDEYLNNIRGTHMKNITMLLLAVLLLASCTMNIPRPYYKHDNGRHRGHSLFLNHGHRSQDKKRVVTVEEKKVKKGKKVRKVEEKNHHNSRH